MASVYIGGHPAVQIIHDHLSSLGRFVVAHADRRGRIDDNNR
jgi:hypothetical protein